MIVNYKKPKGGILVIPCIKNKKVVKTLVLLPGYNEITDEEWNLIKINEKRRIDRGFIELVTKKDKAGNKSIEKSITIKDMDPNEALKVINGTFILDTLEKWLKVEGRDEIRAVIQNKINDVKNYKGKGK